jgi:CubicO group peptidase (beta-lactamase class C family)
MSSIHHTPFGRLTAVAFAVALIAGACGSGNDDAAAPSSTQQSQSDSGEAAFAIVTDEFRAWAEGNDIPGATFAAVIGADTLILTHGQTDLIEGEPISGDSNFRVGSVTKPVTSAVVLQLVDEGSVDLDAPVSDYLTDWAAAATEIGAADVTVRQLLAHTSGFSDYAVAPELYIESLPRLDSAIEPEAIVEFSLEQGLLFEPGTDYNYSTTNYIIAGLIIEAVTGNAAHEEFESRIFDPLGLDGLFLTPGAFPPEPVVNGYLDLRADAPDSAIAPLAGLLGTFSALLPADAVVELEDGTVIDIGALPQEFLTSVGWTGGGLEGQVGDTVRLLPGFFGGEILSSESIREMQTPSEHHNRSVAVIIDEYDGYTIYSHGGIAPGYRAGIAYVPELDLSVAVNTSAVPLESDVHELFRSLAEQLSAAGN